MRALSIKCAVWWDLEISIITKNQFGSFINSSYNLLTFDMVML